MSVFVIVVQWLHVVLAIYWFGSTLFVDTILLPSIGTLALPDQQKIGRLIGPAASRILVPVGLTVILLGFLRGTVFGRLHSLGAVFGSAYGITWFTALLLGSVLAVYGLLVLGPRATALNAAKSPEEYGSMVATLKVLTLIELLLFVSIFTCMILMRFDL